MKLIKHLLGYSKIDKQIKFEKNTRTSGKKMFLSVNNESKNLFLKPSWKWLSLDVFLPFTFIGAIQNSPELFFAKTLPQLKSNMTAVSDTKIYK